MTIFSKIPEGVSVRRLNPKYSGFKFTAWVDAPQGGKRVYGNSIRDVVAKLGEEISFSIA